ncbi:PE-PGRS family protein PE_PGRS18-like [Nasonia vitripennis]|uniref:Uncharacterized protein n=1 Tax=Nasonia vitripennis TaxID=7425 RepID=A0A7M7GBR3_NASVI|nr:PE-PGRS family protein PE_PGRS18-like [Nasonia vitripennis]
MKLLAALLLGVVAALAAASNDNVHDSTILDTLARDKRSLGVDESFKKDVEIKTKAGTSIKISKSVSYNDGGAVAHLPMLIDSLGSNKVRVLQQLQNKRHHGVGGVEVGVGTGGQIGVGGDIGAGFGGDIGTGSHVDVGTGVGGNGHVAVGGQIGTGVHIGIGGQVGTGAQIGIGGQVGTGGHIVTGGQVGHHGLLTGHHNGQSPLHGLAQLIHYKHALKKQRLLNIAHHGQVGVESAGHHHGLLAGHGGLHGQTGGLKSLLARKHALLVEKMSRKLIALSANKPIGAPCCPTGPCCPGNQG